MGEEAAQFRRDVAPERRETVQALGAAPDSAEVRVTTATSYVTAFRRFRDCGVLGRRSARGFVPRAGPVAVGVLRAESHWQEAKIVLEPSAGAAQAARYFVCRNEANSSGRVVDVQSSCDCSALAPEGDVLPSEKGRGRFLDAQDDHSRIDELR
jgi:hypothetical protein